MWIDVYIKITPKIKVYKYPNKELATRKSRMADVLIFAKETLFHTTLLLADSQLTALSKQSKWSITNRAAHRQHA